MKDLEGRGQDLMRQLAEMDVPQATEAKRWLADNEKDERRKVLVTVAIMSGMISFFAGALLMALVAHCP